MQRTNELLKLYGSKEEDKVVDNYLKYKKKINIDNFNYLEKNFYLSKLNLDIVSKIIIEFNNFKGVKYMYHSKEKVNICNLYYFDTIYLQIGPSAISADGEYKSIFICLDDVIKLVNESDKKNMAIAEQFLKNNKNFIYTNIDIKTQLLVISYNLQIILDLVIKGYPLNYSKSYLNLFEPYIKSVILLNKNIRISNIKGYFLTRMGFKAIPLSINDIKNLGEITQSFEREIYLNEKISELVYNSICSNYPLLIKWFIFPTIDKHIYSNEAIHKKYDYSNDYLTKLKYLYKAKVLEGIDVEIVEAYQKKLELPINHMEKNIVLSDYSVGILSTYVGNTLAYLLASKLDSKEPSILNNLHIFKNFTFDILYGLYVLNERVGIIHGDLHLNNITYLNVPDITKNYLYIVKDLKYFILNKKYNFYLIDYGRSFISPIILRADFKKSDNTIYIQNKKILDYFNKVMPEFYSENKFNIEKNLLYNMDTLFKVLTALDIIYVLSNLRININKAFSYDIVDFIISIEEYAKDYLRDNIYSLLNSNKIEDENINKKIINKFFESSNSNEKISSCNNAQSEIIFKYNKEIEITEYINIKKKIAETRKYNYNKEIKKIKKAELEKFKKEGIYN